MGEVVTLNDVPANDVAKMLRLTAERIENGELPTSDLACFVMQTEDDIYIFGWGEDAEQKANLFTMVSMAQQLILDS